MQKFDGVLFATDIDATLLDRKGGLSDENREAISYFMQNGGLFTLNTGRSIQSFEKPRNFLSFNAPVILSNGAVIYDYGADKLLYERNMDEGALLACMEILGEFPEIGMESYRLDGVYSFNPNEASRRHYEYVGIKDPVFVKDPFNMPIPWLKVIFTQDTDYLVRVYDSFLGRFKNRFDLVFSNPYLLEMQSFGINKGSALLKLAELLGIERKNIYCAGDQQNDADMMDVATSFAPANAACEIKKSANYIVSDCDNHAIRDAIRILDTIYGKV